MNNDEFWQYAGKKAAESKGYGGQVVLCTVFLALLIALATSWL